MATVTVRPAGVGDNTLWPSITGGTQHYTVVSDTTVATYIRANSAGVKEDDFTLGAHGLTTETITSIDVRVTTRSEGTAAGILQTGLRLSATNSLATAHTAIPTSDTNYTDLAIARPGGGSWTVSDLSTLQVALLGDRNTASAIRLYEVYVDINYTSAGPGTQTIVPSGIASGEAHGTGVVVPGAVTVVPGGVASAQAFGAPTVIGAGSPQTVIPTGIASGEGFGTLAVMNQNQVIQPTGIPSAESFGSATVSGGGPSAIAKPLDSGKKKYIYKVYDREGVYIGVWRDVRDDLEFTQQINTPGTTTTVILNRSAQNTVERRVLWTDHLGRTYTDHNLQP